MKHRKYKPGYELIILYSGLAIFFTGLYFRNNHLWEFAHVLMFVGVSFKVLFLILFIRKIRPRLQQQKVKGDIK